MSEETPEGTTAAPDPLVNFKSEMDRKLKAQNDSIQQLVQSQQALIASLTTKAAPAASTEENFDDVWYSKPEVAANKIKEQAKAEIRAELATQNADVSQRNNVIANLMQQYPELSNTTSELAQKSIEIYNTLSEREKSEPMAYRLAVKEAAAELGVKPYNKRNQDTDSYSMGNSGGTVPAARTKSSAGLDPATEAFAKLMGVDPKKVAERAKSRKTFNRYE